MKLLALSGSARAASTNTAMLRAMQGLTPTGIHIHVFAEIANLPVFSPDLEGPYLPPKVQAFIKAIAQADGLIIASPEYVHSLPGGLKNAIDWLVSGDEIIHKPITLAHASHRGDDMLATLRIVLETISSRFNPDLFLRFPLLKMPPEDIQSYLSSAVNAAKITAYLTQVRAFVAEPPGN